MLLYRIWVLSDQVENLPKTKFAGETKTQKGNLTSLVDTRQQNRITEHHYEEEAEGMTSEE